MKELMNRVFAVKPSAPNVPSEPKPRVSAISRQGLPWGVFVETAVGGIRDTGLATEVAL